MTANPRDVERDLELLADVPPLSDTSRRALRTSLLSHLSDEQGVSQQHSVLHDAGEPDRTLPAAVTRLPDPHRTTRLGAVVLAAAAFLVIGGIALATFQRQRADQIVQVEPATASDSDGTGREPATAAPEPTAQPSPAPTPAAEPTGSPLEAPGTTVTAEDSNEFDAAELAAVKRDFEMMWEESENTWPPEWAPELIEGTPAVPFSISLNRPDGGSEGMGFADSFSGIRGLRPGEQNRYEIPAGILTIASSPLSGWPDPHINCVGATDVVVAGTTATMRITAGQPVDCVYTMEKDADSLSVSDLVYECGTGFSGTANGPEGPFQIVIRGDALPDASDSFIRLDLAETYVRGPGPFQTDPMFDWFEPGIFGIDAYIVDLSGSNTSLLELPAYFISDTCEGDFSVPLYERFTFAFGESTLQPTAVPPLRLVADFLIRENPANIAVVGFTDEIGAEAANLSLSSDRAAAVASYLADLGVPAARMQSIGLGEREPVAPNTNADGTDNPEGRAANRRVEIRFTLPG